RARELGRAAAEHAVEEVARLLLPGDHDVPTARARPHLDRAAVAEHILDPADHGRQRDRARQDVVRAHGAAQDARGHALALDARQHDLALEIVDVDVAADPGDALIRSAALGDDRADDVADLDVAGVGLEPSAAAQP